MQPQSTLPVMGSDWKSSQEAGFLSSNINTFHESFEIWRITLAADLNLERTAVGQILITIDSVRASPRCQNAERVPAPA